MLILAIDTSCDETAISIYNTLTKIFTNKIYNQIKIHEKTGGIIPQKATYYHYINIIPLIKTLLNKNNLSIKNIQLIAYTAGPGLANSLLIGATTAISLSYLYKIPYIAINHLEGHILSVMLNKKKPNFPFISLLISGANTLLILVKNFNKYKILGKSLDDSIGEILDKISSLMKLGLPGGKQISQTAKLGQKYFIFPKPMYNQNNLNFSFSGLKTHITNLWYKLKKKININTLKQNISYTLERTIYQILIKKTKKALNQYKIKTLSLVGGVSANKTLQKKISAWTKRHNIQLYTLPTKWCTDNADMIAYTSWIIFNKKKFIKNNWVIKTNHKLPLNT